MAVERICTALHCKKASKVHQQPRGMRSSPLVTEFLGFVELPCISSPGVNAKLRTTCELAALPIGSKLVWLDMGEQSVRVSLSDGRHCPKCGRSVKDGFGSGCREVRFIFGVYRTPEEWHAEA
eukprot:5426923-Amphidinium_carterae.1